MIPFSIQNLFMKLKNFSSVKSNIIEEKFTFCKEFEKELELGSGKYSEDIFDFIYNIFEYKRVFDGNKFNKIVSDIFDMNFLEFEEVTEYISSIYIEMVFLNKNYFFDILKLNHDGIEYVEKKYHDNKREIREKLINHF